MKLNKNVSLELIRKFSWYLFNSCKFSFADEAFHDLKRNGVL